MVTFYHSFDSSSSFDFPSSKRSGVHEVNLLSQEPPVFLGGFLTALRLVEASSHPTPPKTRLQPWISNRFFGERITFFFATNFGWPHPEVFESVYIFPQRNSYFFYKPQDDILQLRVKARVSSENTNNKPQDAHELIDFFRCNVSASMLSALQSFDMKDAEHWAEGMDGLEWHKWDWNFRKVVS